MTDYEFASKIYCEVFGVSHDSGDVYIRGVFEAIESLPPSDQTLINYRFCHNYSYKRIGEEIGGSYGKAYNAVSNAMRKLRRNPAKCMLSVKLSIDYRYQMLKKVKDMIDEIFIVNQHYSE